VEEQARKEIERARRRWSKEEVRARSE